MKRLIITGFLGAFLVGCNAAASTPSPAAWRSLAAGPSAVVTPSPPLVSLPSPGTATPSVLPTLTPSQAGAEAGTWKGVKGSARVASAAMPVLVGERGVLLLSPMAGQTTDVCETPGRDPRGLPVSFYDGRTHDITPVSRGGQ